MSNRRGVMPPLWLAALLAISAVRAGAAEPDAEFSPMTPSERLDYAIKCMTGPGAILTTAAGAGIGQAMDRPEEWGSEEAGYGRRLASTYGGLVVSQTIQQSAAFALHEDNRYFSSAERRTKKRIEYAVASTFLARHDDGSRHISISALGGALGSAFITRTWQPPSISSPGDAAVAFGLTMAARIGFNVAREFSPKFVAKHLP